MQAVVSAQGRVLGRDQLVSESVEFLVAKKVVVMLLPAGHPVAEIAIQAGCFVLNWQVGAPEPCVKLLDCMRIGRVWWECELVEHPQVGEVCVLVGRVVYQG